MKRGSGCLASLLFLEILLLALFTALGHAAPFENTSMACEVPTCSIYIGAVTLSYPASVALVQSTITATVIPVVETLPNGQVTTISSTFLQYATDSNVTFTAPATSSLTWQTLGTTFTYPTTYVAYENPSIEIITPAPTLVGQQPQCTDIAVSLTVPPADSSKLIYPITDADPTPGATVAFGVLDSLPQVTSLVGGNPQTCYHGTPTRNTPFNAPAATAVVTHTSVSVLTKVGDPVTLAQNPFSQGGGSPPTPQPDNTAPNTSPGGATPAPAQTTPVVVNGETVVGKPSGTVVVNGQTLKPGVVTTLPNGETLSVASTGGVVVVGSTTVTVAAAATNTAAGGSATAKASSASTGGAVGAVAGLMSWELLTILGASCGLLGILL